MTIQGSLPQHPTLTITINNPTASPTVYGRGVDYAGFPATSPATAALGILQMTPDSFIGSTMVVAIEGIVEVEFGGAVVQGAALTFDVASRLVTAAAGQQIFGRSLQVIAAAGQRGLVEITKEGVS